MATSWILTGCCPATSARRPLSIPAGNRSKAPAAASGGPASRTLATGRGASGIRLRVTGRSLGAKSSSQAVGYIGTQRRGDRRATLRARPTVSGARSGSAYGDSLWVGEGTPPGLMDAAQCWKEARIEQALGRAAGRTVDESPRRKTGVSRRRATQGNAVAHR